MDNKIKKRFKIDPKMDQNKSKMDLKHVKMDGKWAKNGRKFI